MGWHRRCLHERPALDIVVGQVQRFQSEVSSDTKLGHPVVSYHLGASLFRRRVFDVVGLFDPSLRFSEDVDWFNRARELGVSIAVDERVGLFYRNCTSSDQSGPMSLFCKRDFSPVNRSTRRV